MTDYDDGGDGDAGSLVEDGSKGEMEELLILLEEKDSDLRQAAELGKMLLDEKEADAEAHEGEKEALWRRIQDMARRVMELEQEVAESRAEASRYQALQQHTAIAAAAVAGAGAGPALEVGALSRRSCTGKGGGDRAEERALRAKNELLERQLAHMQEEAEETQLELAAARKAMYSRRSLLHHHGGGTSSFLTSPAPSSRFGGGQRSLSGAFSVPPPLLSPARSCASQERSHPVARGGGGVVVEEDGGTPATPCQRRQSHQRRLLSSKKRSAVPSSRRSSVASLHASDVGGDVTHAGGREGEKEEQEEGGRGGVGGGVPDCGGTTLESAADRAHATAATLRATAGVCGESGSDGEDEGEGREGSGEDRDARENDVDWLLQQNAWLMDELESKDELIEALREQLKERPPQQWQGQGPEPFSALQSLRDLGLPADSDDSDDSDNDNDQRSFLDHLLLGNGGGVGGGANSANLPVLKEMDVSSSISNKIARNAVDEAGASPGPASGPTADAIVAADGDASRVKRALPGGAEGGLRSFGEVLAENAMRDVENAGAEGASCRRDSMRSKSPPSRGGRCLDRENSPSPFHGSDLRAGAMSVRQGSAGHEQQQQQRSRTSPSPNRSGLVQGVGGVTGVVGGRAHVGDGEGSRKLPDDASFEGAGAGAGVATMLMSDSAEDGAVVVVEKSTAGGGGGGASQNEEEAAMCSDSITPSAAAAVATEIVAAAPAAAPASAPVTVEPGTTVSGRKRAAAAAKAEARAKQQAEAAAAEAAAAAASSSPSFANMSRAEKKSRQAMEKLGLRTVQGVFRMTMRTSNGALFIIKDPDVLKHPQQDTYVVFGTADMDHAVHVPRRTVVPPRKTAGVPAAATSSSTSMNGGMRSTSTAGGVPFRPDPVAVEDEAISAGLDPADVLTIISHAGCSSQAAIHALYEARGDVVNAVMALTDMTPAA